MSDEMQGGGNKPGMLGKILKALRKYFLILVVVVVVIIGLAFYTTRGVSGFGKTIISKLQAIDRDGIYAVASTGFRSATSADTWDAACQGVGTVLNGKVTEQSAEVGASTSGPKEGTVIYHIVGSDGVTYEVTLKLIDEDGWKLLGLDSVATSVQSTD